MSKTTDLQSLHDQALTEFDAIQSAVREERQQCVEDRRFCSIRGAQWEGPLQMQFENKPKFEVNKVQPAVNRIITEYRNNRISVAFVSKDGSEYDELADACAGLYRADTIDSGADEAHDNAFEEAVTGGFGAYRLRTEYEEPEDEDDDRQRIRVEPIFDADTSVFFDLQAKRQDKADAKSCFVLYSMTPEAYEERWNESPSTFPKELGERFFDWTTPDVVYIAEYYKIEMTSETIHFFQGLDPEGELEKVREDELEERLPMLQASGFREVKTKKVKRQRCRKYILSGNRILEDCGYIAGKHIPIVPVYGKRWFVDNIERCMGHVRLAKDAQRLKNMQLSKLGEISALSSVEKPLFTPEQMAGHQLMWSEDNIKNYPYLLVNPMTDMNGNQAAGGPIGFTRSPQIPPAMAALLQITEQDMQDLLGANKQGEQMVSNISGKAVEMIQQRIDLGTAIYIQNYSKAVKREGEIWLSMAQEVYGEPGRKMKVVTEQEATDQIVLMKPTVNDEGQIEYENDMSEATFDVAVTVGPSSDSKRQSTVRALTGLLAITSDPETQQVLQAMTLMNMEGEGISDVREYFRRKMVQMGVVKPTEEEQAAMQAAGQNQQPTPQDQYMLAAAEQAQADAQKKRADTIGSLAKAQQSEAETQKVHAETLKILNEQGTQEIPQSIEQMPELRQMLSQVQ